MFRRTTDRCPCHPALPLLPAAANEAPIPSYPANLNVKNFGAVGNGIAGGLRSQGGRGWQGVLRSGCQMHCVHGHMRAACCRLHTVPTAASFPIRCPQTTPRPLLPRLRRRPLWPRPWAGCVRVVARVCFVCAWAAFGWRSLGRSAGCAAGCCCETSSMNPLLFLLPRRMWAWATASRTRARRAWPCSCPKVISRCCCAGRRCPSRHARCSLRVCTCGGCQWP